MRRTRVAHARAYRTQAHKAARVYTEAEAVLCLTEFGRAAEAGLRQLASRGRRRAPSTRTDALGAVARLLQMQVRHDALQQSTRAAGRAAVAAAATATEVAATPEPAVPSLAVANAVAARERGGHRRTHLVGFVGNGHTATPTRSALEDLCGRAGPWCARGAATARRKAADGASGWNQAGQKERQGGKDGPCGLSDGPCSLGRHAGWR